MKRLITFLLISTAVLTLAGCKEDGNLDDYYNPNILVDCDGHGDYIVVEGVCLPINDIISEKITINSDETRVEYMNSVELMNDFVADIAGSKGLAVIPRDVFEESINLSGSEGYELINLVSEDDFEDSASNVIVKLTEEGFFEELGFTTENGEEVEITSNPLALEVYGAYTIVVFEVNLGYDNYSADFTQKVWDSLYAGGIYIIHNESGKMFATKEVEQIENIYIYHEDYSRNVILQVTLNEPVIEVQHIPLLDEFNKPVYDSEGKEVFEEIEVPLLDKDGNPVIFTEGPILTVLEETPLMDYYKEQLLDEDGNFVFDELGEPVFEMIAVPVLDKDGNPIMEIQEVPLFDEDGNIQFQEQFEVDLFISDMREITVTEYSAIVNDNPLSMIAQKFVDKIISEYYNWDYYRVNNYMISSYGFATSDESIYYMEMRVDEEDYSKTENFVMRLSFDSTTNEILLEEYINATKAGFTDCEIILDPRNNNVICDPWDGFSNIKVYSSTLGLQTIPDSENLMPVTFPNGELYFYDNNSTYVEELGYYTTVLYNINSDGTLESRYIELGEKIEVCYGSCINNIDVNYFDQDGNLYGDIGYVEIELTDGENSIISADLTIQTVGEFDSVRPECTDPNGCWYYIMIEILDEESNTVASFDSSRVIFENDDVPGYLESYTIDENTEYYYEQQYSNVDLVCDNEFGCTNYIDLIDYSINQYGLWLYQTVIIEQGETLINTITINETNNAVYEYTKDIEGIECTYATCDEEVQVLFYDMNGELLSETWGYVEVAMGEIIPLYVEYHMTENTTVVEFDTVCTTSTGCYEYYETYDNVYYFIYYEQGETRYETITFVETDRVVVIEETLTSEACTDINGCYGEEVEYIVTDNDDNELYVFQSYPHINYGCTMPYRVTVKLEDTTIDYRKEGLTETAICEDTTCNRQVEFVIGDSEFDYEHLGWGYMTFEENDELVYQVRLASTTLFTTIDDMVCNIDEGCIVYTENYVIADDLGNEYQVTMEDWWRSSIPVFFEKGDVMPTDNNFAITVLMTNPEYRTQRLNVYEFIYNLNNIVILDENLYLIESQSWSQGTDNYIMSYNEDTLRYNVRYTNISAVTEITKFSGGYIAINDDETAIINFTFNETLSTDDYYYFDVIDLTEGLQINGVNDLIVDYDGSIYFRGVDNFIQDITGAISEDGVVTIDVELVERVVIRVRPVN